MIEVPSMKGARYNKFVWVSWYLGVFLHLLAVLSTYVMAQFGSLAATLLAGRCAGYTEAALVGIISVAAARLRSTNRQTGRGAFMLLCLLYWTAYMGGRVATGNWVVVHLAHVVSLVCFSFVLVYVFRAVSATTFTRLLLASGLMGFAVHGGLVAYFVLMKLGLVSPVDVDFFRAQLFAFAATLVMPIPYLLKHSIPAGQSHQNRQVHPS